MTHDPSLPAERQGWLGRLRRRAVASFETIAEARRRRLAIAELSQLDDRLLRDMGLSRSTIQYKVRGRRN